ELDGLSLLGYRTAAVNCGFEYGPDQAGFFDAPTRAMAARTRLAITFHPAKDRPSTRSDASVQDGPWKALRSSSRLPAFVAMPDELLVAQLAGPSQKLHSTPA